MKLFDVNGELVSVDVRPSSNPVKQNSKSKLQQKVGEFLQDKHPRDVILEEWRLPGSRLSLDFFLPTRKIAVEVQGDQHSEYIPHFHGSELLGNFAKQKGRDAVKANWCEMNGVRLIEVFTEKDIEDIYGT